MNDPAQSLGMETDRRVWARRAPRGGRGDPNPPVSSRGLGWDNSSDLPQLENRSEKTSQVGVKPKGGRKGQRAGGRAQREGETLLDLFDELNDIQTAPPASRRVHSDPALNPSLIAWSLAFGQLASYRIKNLAACSLGRQASFKPTIVVLEPHYRSHP